MTYGLSNTQNIQRNATNKLESEKTKNNKFVCLTKNRQKKKKKLWINKEDEIEK